LASPQIENGFTKIANELFDEILKRDFSKRELKIIFVIIRKTYGWNVKEDEISIRYFEGATGIRFRHVVDTLNELHSKKIIHFSRHPGHSQKRKISLNKDYDKWLTDTKTVSVSKTDRYQNSNSSDTKTVSETDTETVSNKERKENNKESSAFSFFWNLYDKKTGKKEALTEWEKLSSLDKQKILEYIPAYKSKEPDQQFRKNPVNFLKSEIWKEPIEFTHKEVSSNKKYSYDEITSQCKGLSPEETKAFWNNFQHEKESGLWIKIN